MDLERRRISQEQFVTHIAAALSVDPEGLLERIIADLRFEPLVVDTVARLRSCGIKVAVLSNSWGSAPFDPYARFQLSDRYDVVVATRHHTPPQGPSISTSAVKTDGSHPRGKPTARSLVTSVR